MQYHVHHAYTTHDLCRFCTASRRTLVPACGWFLGDGALPYRWTSTGADLTDIEIYQPDILFVSNERSDIVAERIHGAPDLVVEILSPSTAYYDLQHKRYIYAESGVREYWIVDPEERSIAVYSNNNGVFLKLCEARGGDEVWSDVLRGFRVEIETLFG